MSDIEDQLTTAQNAIGAALTDLENETPTLADQVLEAVTPVLEAAGWTAPAELPETTEPETT